MKNNMRNPDVYHSTIYTADGKVVVTKKHDPTKKYDKYRNNPANSNWMDIIRKEG